MTLIDAKSQANLGDGWSLAVFRQRANPIKEDISELAGVFQGHGAKTLPRHVENLTLYCDASDVAGLTIWTGLPQRAFPYPGGVTPDHMALDSFTYVSDALYQSMRSAGVDDFSVAIPITDPRRGLSGRSARTRRCGSDWHKTSISDHSGFVPGHFDRDGLGRCARRRRQS